MGLQSQLYPQVAYAPTEAYYTTNGYEQQEDYYSMHGYAQQQDAYYSSDSSMQQMKPYPYITTPQPSKNQVVGYLRYGQHDNGWYGNHHNYVDNDSYDHDKHALGKHHRFDFYGKPHGYDNHNSHGYPHYPNGPRTSETMNYSYHVEDRVRCPSDCCQHTNHHQNSASHGADWIYKSLDDGIKKNS